MAVKSSSRDQADTGFTLVEVIVAMLLIGAALMTLLGLSTGGLRAQEAARRQQVANGLASDVMERLRVLDWSTLKMGSNFADLQGDPNVKWDCAGGQPRLKDCGSQLGEEIVYSLGGSAFSCVQFTSFTQLYAAGQDLPLRPSHCTAYTLNYVDYRAYAYVTRANQVTAAYRLTVIVRWSQTSPPAQPQPAELILQSLVWENSGCKGGNPMAPCAPKRKSQYKLASPVLSATYCKVDANDPSKPCTTDPSTQVVVNLGHPDLTLEENPKGVATGSGSVTMPSITVAGTPMLKSVSSPTVSVETGGNLTWSVPWNVQSMDGGTILGDRSYRTQNFTKYRWLVLGTWKLTVSLDPAPDCGPGVFACGSIVAAASGACPSGGAAPCLNADSSYGGATIQACKVADHPTYDTNWPQPHEPEYSKDPVDKDACFTLATMVGGKSSIQLSPSASMAAISGFDLKLGGYYDNGDSGSTDSYLYQVQVLRKYFSKDPFGLDPNIPDSDQTGADYWVSVKASSGSGCFDWKSGVDADSKLLTGNRCIHAGTITGTLPTQLYGLQSVSGTVTGSGTWVMVRPLDTECEAGGSLVNKGQLIPMTGSAGDNRGCQLIAPASTLGWTLPNAVTYSETP